MRHRHAAEGEIREQRLDVAGHRRTRGRIAVVADGNGALEAFDRLLIAEGLADLARPAQAVELLAVGGDDAGGLLAAMLEGMQAERGMRGRVGMAGDAEHPAFLMQLVVVEGVNGSQTGLPR